MKCREANFKNRKSCFRCGCCYVYNFYIVAIATIFILVLQIPCCCYGYNCYITWARSSIKATFWRIANCNFSHWAPSFFFSRISTWCNVTSCIFTSRGVTSTLRQNYSAGTLPPTPLKKYCFWLCKLLKIGYLETNFPMESRFSTCLVCV